MRVHNATQFFFSVLGGGHAFQRCERQQQSCTEHVSPLKAHGAQGQVSARPESTGRAKTGTHAYASHTWGFTSRYHLRASRSRNSNFTAFSRKAHNAGVQRSSPEHRSRIARRKTAHPSSLSRSKDCWNRRATPQEVVQNSSSDEIPMRGSATHEIKLTVAGDTTRALGHAHRR